MTRTTTSSSSGDLADLICPQTVYGLPGLFRFGQSGKTWSDSVLSAPDSGVFKLRIESQNPADPAGALRDLPAELEVGLAEKIARISEGSLELEVNNANLEFLSSTLTKLSEWAQDEILPTPVPMTIDVRNVAFTLTDDNPPVRGCPEPPPVDFSVPELRLVRDKSGMFTVTAAPVSSTDTTPLPVSSSAHNGQDDNVRRELELALSEVRILRARLAEKQVQITDLKTRNKTLTVSKKQSVSQVENKLFREEEVS